MEPSTIGDDSKIYTNLNRTQTDNLSWFNDPLYAGSTKVARLKNATRSSKVSPSIIFKVMAGDSYNIRVTSGWYSSSTAYINNTGVLTLRVHWRTVGTEAILKINQNRPMQYNQTDRAIKFRAKGKSEVML